ncbi:MAG: aminotransferase-like domain-containing protein [Bacilli bacterium]
MNYRLSAVARDVKASAVREILKLTQNDSIISFAGGLPAEELFPKEALQQAFERVFQQGNRALQYGLTEGYTPLREAIAARMVQKGMPISARDVLLTTGSQQAIDLLARVLIEPGDVILVEDPTYLSALQIFRYHSAVVEPVQTDDDGMDLAALEQKILHLKPKFLYVTPTFGNPTGRVWSVERRQQLVTLCRLHDVLIVEDDPYGEIIFDPTASYPSIYSLDALDGGATVVYTSTFSKIVAPALRIGWVMGHPTVIGALARAKQAADLHSSSLDQQALFQLLAHFDLDAHIAVIRTEYKKRMLLMDDLLTQYQLSGVRWNKPAGGMFLWLTLPETVMAEDLLSVAVKEGVAFVPGTEFYAHTPEKNTLRLNFSHSAPLALEAGVERLSRSLDHYLDTYDSQLMSHQLP